MQDWRKYGPIGVLFDIIASICTPQTRQLLQRLQQEEADALREPVKLKDLVKPVKTRWNFYYAAFARAVELQGLLIVTLSTRLTRIATQKYLRVALGVQAPMSQRSVFHPVTVAIAEDYYSCLDCFCAREALTPVTGQRSLSI
jgi:hypothetical protein